MYSPYPTRGPEGFGADRTGFYVHDDEGALMIGVKQYVAGTGT